jgi:hypothetical protein
MEYRVISASFSFSANKALEQLVREVNEAIRLGWEPMGGVMVMQGWLLQAMIKRR